MAVNNNGRNVATKGSDHIAAAIAPDVCYAGRLKLPFPNWVRSRELKNGQTTTVLIENHPIWTSAGELGPKSQPMHIGIHGGVVSNTYRFEAKAVSYSRDLFYEGNLAVRTDDLTSQNHENTVGRVVEGISTAQLLAELQAMVWFKRTPSWGRDVVITKRGDRYIVIDHKNRVFYITGDTLKINGNARFVQQTREALYTLGNTRSGRVLFGELVDSRRSVTIEESNLNNGFCIAANGADAQNPGVGTNSLIQWNPTFSMIPNDSRGPAVLLGHELVHAHHNALGIDANGPCDNYAGQQGCSSRGEERRTVGTSQTTIIDPAGNAVSVPDYSAVVPSENSFRRDLQLPSRTTYYPPNWTPAPPW